MSDVQTYLLSCGHIVEDDADVVGPQPRRIFCHTCEMFLVAVECLDGLPHGEGCEGPVAYRYALSPTGVSYPRCEKHWQYRLTLQEDLNRRYPSTPPPDFDPLNAGESWDDN